MYRFNALQILSSTSCFCCCRVACSNGLGSLLRFTRIAFIAALPNIILCSFDYERLVSDHTIRWRLWSTRVSGIVVTDTLDSGPSRASPAPRIHSCKCIRCGRVSSCDVCPCTGIWNVDVIPGDASGLGCCAFASAGAGVDSLDHRWYVSWSVGR